MMIWLLGAMATAAFLGAMFDLDDYKDGPDSTAASLGFIGLLLASAVWPLFWAFFISWMIAGGIARYQREQAELAMSCRALRLAVLGLVLSAPLGAAEPSCPQGETITGTARAIDGDTIEVLFKMKIRLQGVAAPELHEYGGRASAAAMRDIVDGHEVHCLLDGTSTHGRCVASCYIGALDIGWEIIRQGYARDCPRFCGFRYLDAELEADLDSPARSYDLPRYCEPRG